MTHSKLLATGMMLCLLAVTLVGCDTKGEQQPITLLEKGVGSFAENLAESLSAAKIDRPESEIQTTVEQEPVKIISELTAAEIYGTQLYAVFEGGLVRYDFEGETQTFVPVDDKLTAIVLHRGEMYVGGSKLYKMSGETFEPVAPVEPVEPVGPVIHQPNVSITSLYSYGSLLMVGTETGLYSQNEFGRELLLDEVSVTAMVEDSDGLWVGTDGQGLYRWDGEKFQKRYLIRDPSMFDSVNSLAFSHNHLYVGSKRGLHIFNGGFWKNLTTDDGLPSDDVVSIDASGWIVYAATPDGVVSWFNNELLPVKKLAETDVRVVRVFKRQLVAATEYEGVFLRSGNVLKAIIHPILDRNIDYLSLIQ